MAGPDKVTPLFIKAEFFLSNDKTNKNGKTLLMLMFNSHNVLSQFYLSGFLGQASEDGKITKEDKQKINTAYRKVDILFSIPHEVDLNTQKYWLEGPKLIFTDVLLQAEELVKDHNQAYPQDKITKIQLIDVSDINLLTPAGENFPSELFQHMVDEVEKIGKNNSLECAVDIQSFSAIHDANKKESLESQQSKFKENNKHYVEKADFIGDNAVDKFKRYLHKKFQNIDEELIHLHSYKASDDFKKELERKKEDSSNKQNSPVTSPELKGKSAKKPEKPTTSLNQEQLVKPHGDEQVPANYSQNFSLSNNWKSYELPPYKKTPAITTLSTLDEEEEKTATFKNLKKEFEKFQKLSSSKNNATSTKEVKSRAVQQPRTKL